MSKFKIGTGKELESDLQNNNTGGGGVLSFAPNVPSYRPKDGENAVRLVPPLAEDRDADFWGLTVWQHYIGGRYVLSPRTFDQSANDPIVANYKKLKDSGQAEKSRLLAGSMRRLFWVLDCNIDKDADLKVHIWNPPAAVADDLLRVSRNRKTGELLSINHPETGRTVFFDKSGTGIQTKLTSFELDTEPFPLDKKIIDEISKFRDILVVPTVEEAQELVDGVLSNESGSNERSFNRPVSDSEEFDNKINEDEERINKEEQDAAQEAEEEARVEGQGETSEESGSSVEDRVRGALARARARQ